MSKKITREKNNVKYKIYACITLNVDNPEDIAGFIKQHQTNLICQRVIQIMWTWNTFGLVSVFLSTYNRMFQDSQWVPADIPNTYIYPDSPYRYMLMIKFNL